MYGNETGMGRSISMALTDLFKIETFLIVNFHSLKMDFVPIVRPRNYAPTRLFVTKWEHEQVKTGKKKRERRAEHDYKYAEQDLTDETLYMTCTMDRLYDIVQKEAYEKPDRWYDSEDEDYEEGYFM
jgi:hypothetical protein